MVGPPDPAAESHIRETLATHSAQASSFAASYRTLSQDPYGSCFVYSRKRLEIWLDRLLPSPSGGRRALDVGCGTGHHLAWLRAKGFDVAGVDGSAAMLAEARALHPKGDLRLAQVDRLPFAMAAFDVVLCIEVLRYLSDPTPCLREMARVLRPGGTLVATAHPILSVNGYPLVNRLATVLPRVRLVALKQFFTTSSRLHRQLRGAGFAEIEIHGVYFGPLNWIERLMRPLLSPALRAWEPIDAAISDRPVLRDMSNMFVVKATKVG